MLNVATSGQGPLVVYVTTKFPTPETGMFTTPVSQNSQKLVVRWLMTFEAIPLVNSKSYSMLGAASLSVNVPLFSVTLALLLITGQVSAALKV